MLDTSSRPARSGSGDRRDFRSNRLAGELVGFPVRFLARYITIADGFANGAFGTDVVIATLSTCNLKVDVIDVRETVARFEAHALIILVVEYCIHLL